MSASGGIGPSLNGQQPYSVAPGQFVYPAGQQLPGTNAMPASVLRLIPIYMPPLTIAGIGCEVTVAGVAGTTIRPAIYFDNGNGLPSGLFLDPGTLAGDVVALPQINLGASVKWPGGIAWLGGVRQGVAGANPTVRSVGYNLGLAPLALAAVAAADSYVGVLVNGVAGALPASIAGSTSPLNVGVIRLFIVGG